MSQEEHILHQLKEMHNWIANADKQMSRVKWALYGIAVLLVIELAVTVFK